MEPRCFLVRHDLPSVRFHDLRHAAGSIMLKNGIPMYTVSRVLGHSNVATTVDTYGHVEEKAFGEAAAGMRRALGLAPPSVTRTGCYLGLLVR